MEEDEIDERTEKTLLTRIRKKKIEILKDRLAHLEQIRNQRALEEEIAEAEDDLFRDDDDDEDEDKPDGPDAMITQLLTKAFSSSATAKNPHPPTQNDIFSYVAERSFTDEQLLGMKKKIPGAMLSKLQKLDDEKLVETIQLQSPDFFNSATDKDIARAITILKEVP